MNECSKVLKRLIPFYPGIFAFGLVFSTVAVSAGVSVMHAIFMAVAMYSGSAQIVTIQLLSENSTLIFMVLSTLIIGSRFFMYSLSLSDAIIKMSPLTRCVMSVLMVDQIYFLVLERHLERGSQESKDQYYCWLCIVSYTWWLISVVFGVFFGMQLVKALSGSQINFLSIMAFVIVLYPCLKEKYNFLVIVFSCAFFCLFHALSYSVAMMLSAFCGVILTMTIKVISDSLLSTRQ